MYTGSTQSPAGTAARIRWRPPASQRHFSYHPGETCGLLFLLAMALLPACTSTSDIKPMSETMHSDYVPPEEEIWAIEQADLYHREIRQQGLLYGDEKVTDYLGRVETRLLARQAPLQDSIDLFVMRSPSPNAFAFPNGNIYLHAGIFTTLDSEDELASIAAHEIAHITERHSVKAVIANKKKLIGSHIADFATGGFGLVYFGTFASIMHFSREQESAADRIGMTLLAEAGYRPQAMVEAFESLDLYPELRHQKNSIYSSHPTFHARINELRTMAAEQEQVAGLAVAPDSIFKELKALMMEDSLRIRLRNREYNLSLTILNAADNYFGDTAKGNFYRGEVYYGFYNYPELAAREYHFIQTGKDKANKDTTAKFIAEKERNLATAIQNYQSASKHSTPYAKSLRRLGDIEQARGNSKQALEYFTQYLVLQPDASDRPYVEHAMRRLGDQTGEHL